jgi:serine/threonine-protein kinase HipA
MRKAKIYYKDQLAGVLTERTSGEYVFQYDTKYVSQHPDQFITFTMPVRTQPYIEQRLFAFFDGLIPEGWLLDITTKNWKIDKNDRMGLLLACCENCIGAVSVQAENQKENE